MSKKRKFMYWIGGLLILTLVVPNTTNFKERNAFSDERRLEEAMELYHADSLQDSAVVVPGDYYDRGKLFTFFLGEKQRELWRTPVKVKVFDYEETKGGLKPFETGGGNQTTSLRLKDNMGRKWALRSVNKDQKEALPLLFRPTFLRFMFRDQVAAMNPYGHLAVPVLAEALGIYHNKPQLVLVPYDSAYGEFNEIMAGRLAYLEEHLNSSWRNSEQYGSPVDIVNTEEMLEMQQYETIPVDTLMYLKARLLDMLISDWDRHPGQWEWALTESAGKKIFRPVPKDRDIAFYRFNEGILSHLTLGINNKFQSFRKDYGSISGLMKQSEEQDKGLLSGIPAAQFASTAEEIRQELKPEVIEKAFRQYPKNIYEMTGRDHEETLKARLDKLPEAAARFHELLQE